MEYYLILRSFFIFHTKYCGKDFIFIVGHCSCCKLSNHIRFLITFCFRCKHEYLDLYSEVQNPDTTELINSPFGGRFCGSIPPRGRISLYRTIAFSFYTDKNDTTPDIFTGRYAFINDCKYARIMARPVSSKNMTYK